MRSQWRFLIAAVLLGCTALLMHARNSGEIVPAHPALNSFPRTMPGWSSTDISIPAEVLDVLGPGDFLLRNYRDESTNSNVDLFVAYFPSQRSGDTIHSPKNCIPGAGWTPIWSDRISIALPGQIAFPANRYVIAKGEDRRLVLYWYWAHDRAVASEYWAKFYLVADSVRMRRSDGSLIRLTTAFAPGESMDSAQHRLLALAEGVVPLINNYVPR
jgi:EpsI family protein